MYNLVISIGFTLNSVLVHDVVRLTESNMLMFDVSFARNEASLRTVEFTASLPTRKDRSGNDSAFLLLI